MLSTSSWYLFVIVLLSLLGEHATPFIYYPCTLSMTARTKEVLDLRRWVGALKRHTQEILSGYLPAYTAKSPVQDSFRFVGVRMSTV